MSISLTGVLLAQLAIGVLGVLLETSEYLSGISVRASRLFPSADRLLRPRPRSAWEYSPSTRGGVDGRSRSRPPPGRLTEPDTSRLGRSNPARPEQGYVQPQSQTKPQPKENQRVHLDVLIAVTHSEKATTWGGVIALMCVLVVVAAGAVTDYTRFFPVPRPSKAV